MATISNADITQASSLTTSTDGKYTVTGSGIFDDLMEAVNVHLSAQYNLGRLTGADYATVYLGALQSSLQGSVQFVLGKQQADKQADLLTKQILTEEKKTLDITNQSLIRTQANSTETILKRQQIISEAFKNGMEVNEYIWEIEYNQNANETYTFTTNENLSDNDVEALMTEDPHVATYTVKTVVLNQVNNIQHSGKSTAETVIAKTNKEIEILEQKRITEYAQTQVTTNAAPAAGSIVGRQGTLYEKQALGFEWDAKNSFNKNIADILKIQINTLGTFNNQKFVTIEDLLEPFASDAAFVPNTTQP